MRLYFNLAILFCSFILAGCNFESLNPYVGIYQKSVGSDPACYDQVSVNVLMDSKLLMIEYEGADKAFQAPLLWAGFDEFQNYTQCKIKDASKSCRSQQIIAEKTTGREIIFRKEFHSWLERNKKVVASQTALLWKIRFRKITQKNETIQNFQIIDKEPHAQLGGWKCSYSRILNERF